MNLVVRGARLPTVGGLLDIGVVGGRIARIAPHIAEPGATEISAGGRLAIPGMVESHFHLDKALLGAGAPRGAGDVQGAIRATAEAKRAFTVEDIQARARRALEMAIRRGTTLMRTHVEVDPIVGLQGMEAILPLQREYAWAIDLQICVFPQEGILQTPGTEALMRAALRLGGDAVGGVPYNDTDGRAHLRLVFDLAREFDRDVDLHLDFFDEPGDLLIGEVADLTLARGWMGRVLAGHVSALGALEPSVLAPLAARIREAGVSIVVLPATDLYLMGRNDVRNVRRGLAPVRRLLDAGVNVAVATNNVQNPFTPFGDADLLRIANLLATAAHFGTTEDLVTVLELATDNGARALRRADYGLVEGARADLVLLDCTEPAEAVAAIPERLCVLKGCRLGDQSRGDGLPGRAAGCARNARYASWAGIGRRHRRHPARRRLPRGRESPSDEVIDAVCDARGSAAPWGGVARVPGADAGRWGRRRLRSSLPGRALPHVRCLNCCITQPMSSPDASASVAKVWRV